MYKDTGSKIKQRAESLSKLKVAWYIVLALFSIVLFFHFGTIPGKQWPAWAPQWIIFVFLALPLYFVPKAIQAWNQHLFLAAYGELIQANAKTAEQIEQVKWLLQDIKDQNATANEVSIKTEEQLEQVKWLLQSIKRQNEAPHKENTNKTTDDA